MTLGSAAVVLLVVIAAGMLVSSEGLAQGARHPFAVGASEGAATTTNALSRFLIEQESGFYRLLTGAVRAIRDSSAAAWALIGLSFGYGVVHAAGPGHGKAVIASYLLANEKTFARGVIISAAAAFLQGSVAVAIVGTAAVLFHATSKQMNATARIVEIASYAGITLLGGLLVYRKGKALLSLRRVSPLAALEFAFAAPASPRLARGDFAADDCGRDHTHDAGCGHGLALDPRALAADRTWKAIALTILAAGLRPCSGAILVLVFAMAQGVLLAGILSVAAMSLGTAITTSALATFAVLAKKTAAKFAAANSKSAMLVGRVVEAAAALIVLALGLVLLTTSLFGVI